MLWNVEFVASARRELLDLHEPIKTRIHKKIALLESNPFPTGFKKLRRANDCYRIRIGDYRVLYRVTFSIRLVEIFRISHRRDAYRRPS